MAPQDFRQGTGMQDVPRRPRKIFGPHFSGEGGAPVVVSWVVYWAVYWCTGAKGGVLARNRVYWSRFRVFPVYWSQTRLRAVGRRRTASSTHLPRARIHGPRPNACTGMLRSEAACTIGQIACIWSHSTSVIVAELIVVVVVTSCKARRASTLSSTVGKGVSTCIGVCPRALRHRHDYRA
jgi:hypothetical protein